MTVEAVHEDAGSPDVPAGDSDADGMAGDDAPNEG